MIHSMSWCFHCPLFMGKVKNFQCKECKPDSLQDAGAGEDCNQNCVNQHRDLGDDECSDCPYGSYYNSSVVREGPNALETRYSPRCNECAVGQYADRLVFDECLKCNPGTYNNKTGQSDKNACMPCPAGTFNLAYGSSSISDCLPCPSGRFSNEIGMYDLSG